MSFAKAVFVVCGATLALTTFASAAEEWDIKDRQAFFLMPSGSPKSVMLNDSAHAMLMKDATPLSAGTVIFRSGNRYYVMSDKRMPDGKMMFERPDFQAVFK